MEEVFASTAFRVYAAVSAVLAVKLALLAAATGILRSIKGPVRFPEDAKGGTLEIGPDAPLVHRLNRIHANGIENELLFMVLGMLYAAVGAPAWGMQIYAYTYLASRLLHLVFYMLGLQPFRTGAWLLGWLCLIGLSVQVLMGAFA